MTQTSLIVKNLCINLQGEALLENISFSLHQQEHLAILGESGSGKTLLAKALSGQLFYQGSIEVYFESHSMLRKKYFLYRSMSIFKNLSNTSDFFITSSDTTVQMQMIPFP